MSNYHSQIGIYDQQGGGDSDYRGFDASSIRAQAARLFAAPERPIDVLAAKVSDLEAKLELANARIFFLVSDLAKANAKLGITDYRTQP